MLQRFAPRAARSLLSRPSAGFCLYKSYMDPHKHNTMNHNLHNVYIDLYDVGVYPELVINQSEPSRVYEEQLRSLAVGILSKDYVIIISYSLKLILFIYKIIHTELGMMH